MVYQALGNFIDGSRHQGDGDPLPVSDPATGESLRTPSMATRAHWAAAIKAASATGGRMGINHFALAAAGAALCGIKASGMGRRSGSGAIQDYLNAKPVQLT